jgi:TatD DNase family protein
VTGWFDSHCHVQEEYQDDLPAVLGRAREAGIDRLICIGTGDTTSRQAVALARASQQSSEVPRAWASIGLHPHEASVGTDAVTLMAAEEMAVGDGAVVAVGECGLDYFYEHSPRPAQRTAFAAQITLAHQLDLALVIHARDAWDDLFAILASEGVPARTVLHCFTGGPTEVERCLAEGMFVSFSGIITFKNAHDVREAVALCPLEQLLVETDSPFLAPVPHRGRPNEPALLPFVGATVAEVKGCSVEEVRQRSAEAASRAFSLPR